MTQRVRAYIPPRASPFPQQLSPVTVEGPEPQLSNISNIIPSSYKVTEDKMMFYSILASFCLLGIARSQSIDDLTACVTKNQNLEMECKFTPATDSKATVICTYELDKKVVATNGNKSVDPTFKNRGTVSFNNNVCKLTLTGFADEQAKMFNCTIKQDKTASKEKEVQKKNLKECSAGNSLKHGGVVLLLAFVLPLLSGML